MTTGANFVSASSGGRGVLGQCSAFI